MSTLGEDLPREMARVRDELIPVYLECGKVGLPAVSLMRRDLDQAAKAMAEGDVVAMLHAYNELKGWQL